MRCVKTLALGILLGAAGPGLHAQAKPAPTATKPAPQPQAKPAAQNAPGGKAGSRCEAHREEGCAEEGAQADGFRKYEACTGERTENRASRPL